MAEWTSLDEWFRELGEAELRLILWAAWDPIGHVPRDEYDTYIPRLWTLLREHALVLRTVPDYDELPETEQDEITDRTVASLRKIEALLSGWRTGEMGLAARPEEDRAVAWKLSEWLSPSTTDEFKPADLPR